ncbi:MAG: 4Fe-4S dicluster domain-containing protein [Euryarchaeota archaeon]|nr:4Fe-4S dicluster domain-containing protein [Euryarchaeota archaeon]
MFALEALKMLLKKPFTWKYPFEPIEVPEGFRGKPEYDEENCIGCGACAAVCPAEAITVTEDAKVVLTLSYADCTFCADCEKACQWDAITLSKEFELATLDKSQAIVQIEREKNVCEGCGGTISAVEQMDWIKEEISEIKDNIPADDLEAITKLCPECRRDKAAENIISEVYS